MKRPKLLILFAFIIALGAGNSGASLAVTPRIIQIPFVVMVQSNRYVVDGDVCQFDTGGTEGVLLALLDENGTELGGTLLRDGEIIPWTGLNGAELDYCGFAAYVAVPESDYVDIELDGQILITLRVETLSRNLFVLLEVEDRGLVQMGFRSDALVEAMGLVPVEATPPPGLATGAATPQSAIEPGVWLLEHPATGTRLVVFIYEDPEGTEPENLANLDPVELEDGIGSPILSEDAAPEGCRAFTIQGPYGMQLYMGMCADGQYGMLVEGDDQDEVHVIMLDFMDGKPFTVPPGYEEME